MKRLYTDRRFLGILTASFAFVIYLRTLAPGVTFIDSGELAAVACTLGIAHPTGYPLFTLLGWICSKIPFGGGEIFRLNVMAAFLCAAGIGMFFHVMLSTLKAMSKQNESTNGGLLAASAGASLLLAFSSTYWEQALSVEVYSLHLFFISTLLYFYLGALFRGRTKIGANFEDRVDGRKRWMLFMFVVGLSFTNHMTTVFLAPGLIIFFFRVNGFNRWTGRLLLSMTLPFIAGLSLYLYLPIRSAQQPLFNWGDPVTLERFVRHLSGKQYSVWFFTSVGTMGRQLGLFVDSLPHEFTIAGLALAAVGFVLLWMRERRLSLLFGTLFASCVLLAINYDIYDISSYFLLAYVVMAIWGGVGLWWLIEIMKRWLGQSAIPVLLLLAVSLCPLFFHYSERDESANFLVEDYAMNMLNSVEKDALVISYQWDFWVSASYYLQYVKGVRTDVTVVDKELLRRSWYLTELEHRYPWLIASSADRVEAFRHELFKFEHDIPYDPQVIQLRFVEMIRSFIKTSLPEHPVYVTPEIEPEFSEGFQRVPSGLAFKLVRGKSFEPVPMPAFQYRSFSRTGRLEDQTKTLYGDMLTARGAYYYKIEPAESEKSFLEALKYDPGSKRAKFLLEKLRSEGLGDGDLPN